MRFNSMRNLKSWLIRETRGFHDDEDGIEAIQVVMILAIAAVALLVIKNKWEAIKSFFGDNTDKAIDWSP